MTKTVKIIIALVTVGAIVIVALLLGGKPSKDDTNNTGDKKSAGDASSSATITYDGNSFSPSEVTVSSGGSVTFVNNSDNEVEPSSNNHPTHTLNPEINFGAIAPGESKTMTVDATGDWQYHNHLSSSQTGTIHVE